MTFVTSFVKIGLLIQKPKAGGTDALTNRIPDKRQRETT
jgi:hypothetical protein